MPAYGNSYDTPSEYNQANRVIEAACAWAVNIANDDSHGYSQSVRWGPDYDCSSLVISAYRAAGLTINANSTHDMINGFKPAGFNVIVFTSGMNLLRGDVLLKPSSHTALYLGSGLVVEAHLAETGRTSGATGDQGYYMYHGQRVNQGEISVGTYSFSRTWDYVLRYGPGSTVAGNDIIIPSGQYSTYTDTGIGSIARPQDSALGLTVYSDVRNSGAPNDRHDMTIREIAYWSDDSRFVTTPTDIKISAINYTTLLGNLYDQFAQYYPNGYTVDRSHFTGNIRVVLDYFADKGLNPAAGCGIAASLYVLSGIGTQNQGKGICAWEGKYKQDMHHRVESWSNNLTGQLDFLWQDLALNYTTMIQLLNNLPVTDNGARQAANRFMISYRYTDQPQSTDIELSRSTHAQNTAANWFNQLNISAIVPYGTSYTTPTQVTIPSFGTDLTASDGFVSGGDLDILTDIPILPAPGAGVVYSLSECPYPQTGINTAFTSYSSWYNDWNKSSPQYKLAHMWGTQFGRSCNRGIATINGYYLIAVSATYGTVGTALEVALENGETFRAVIADIKSSGDSNYCPWGHLDGNGRVNVIEWEVVKVLPGGIAATSGDRYAGYPPDLTGWQGINVRYIKNLGKMFDLTWG